jgi:hypothetical protein
MKKQKRRKIAMSKKKIKYVYIAGPLTPRSQTQNHALEHLENIGMMLRAWGILLAAGFHPFCPAFDILGILVLPGQPTEEKIKTNSLGWLKKCDAIVLLPGWAKSSGARAEVKLAKTLGLKIFLDIQEAVKWGLNQ